VRPGIGVDLVPRSPLNSVQIPAKAVNLGIPIFNLTDGVYYLSGYAGL
jgi:hypothetical protein